MSKLVKTYFLILLEIFISGIYVYCLSSQLFSCNIKFLYYKYESIIWCTMRVKKIFQEFYFFIFFFFFFLVHVFLSFIKFCNNILHIKFIIFKMWKNI